MIVTDYVKKNLASVLQVLLAQEAIIIKFIPMSFGSSLKCTWKKWHFVQKRGGGGRELFFNFNLFLWTYSLTYKNLMYSIYSMGNRLSSDDYAKP